MGVRCHHGGRVMSAHNDATAWDESGDIGEETPPTLAELDRPFLPPKIIADRIRGFAKRLNKLAELVQHADAIDDGPARTDVLMAAESQVRRTADALVRFDATYDPSEGW